jgi:hypothetical protein
MAVFMELIVVSIIIIVFAAIGRVIWVIAQDVMSQTQNKLQDKVSALFQWRTLAHCNRTSMYPPQARESASKAAHKKKSPILHKNISSRHGIQARRMATRHGGFHPRRSLSHKAAKRRCKLTFHVFM